MVRILTIKVPKALLSMDTFRNLIGEYCCVEEHIVTKIEEELVYENIYI